MRIFLLSFLIIQNSFAQPPKIIDLLKYSKSQKEFEKFMIINDCVISNVYNSPKFYCYEHLVSNLDSSKMVNEMVVNSYWRPSKNTKYDRKYTSTSYPFYGEVLTVSYLSKLIPLDSLWQIINQPEVKTVGFFDENVTFEPTLINASCYSTINSEKEYAWNYNEVKTGAEIYFTHNLKTTRDCSLEEKLKWHEKTLKISTRERIYNSYLKEIMSVCQFDESTEIDGNFAQKFNYTDKVTNQKCIITCTRIEEDNSCEILIYWKIKN
jgi:hypothetical protein